MIQEPEMINIPEGTFYMGTSEQQVAQFVNTEDWAKEWADDGRFEIEQPYHLAKTSAFQIAKYPVTNKEYYKFLMQTGHRLPQFWTDFRHPAEYGNHPVAGVSYADCLMYCDWINSETNSNYRLPTETEWEKAARGTDGRMYPWGNKFEKWRCNTAESNRAETSSVGIFSPSGDSPWGVCDIAGNVFEWTMSAYAPYPIEENPLPNPKKPDENIVIRGGGWYYSRKLVRCAAREVVIPTFVSPVLGFRLAKTP